MQTPHVAVIMGPLCRQTCETTNKLDLNNPCQQVSQITALDFLVAQFKAKHDGSCILNLIFKFYIFNLLIFEQKIFVLWKVYYIPFWLWSLKRTERVKCKHRCDWQNIPGSTGRWLVLKLYYCTLNNQYLQIFRHLNIKRDNTPREIAILRKYYEDQSNC